MNAKLIDGVYQRFHAITDEIDQKGSSLQAWQVSSLHQLAEECEKVLSGERRGKNERRG